ncbi:thioesterase II family protein [Streptomyces roseolilacinus]|uniref:thioesterase II family protein n=1 Tax=Streptomyces roseolilacinus TaxID=66904 RepID=UPI00382F8974
MTGTTTGPAGTDTRWVRPCAGHWRTGRGPVLLCLPHAGGGALSYSGWERYPLGGYEPVAVRLPGREDRFEEAPVRDWPTLVTAIADALGDLANRPMAVFGHSMGALTAYELVRELLRRGGVPPVLLAVSAHLPPQRMPGTTRPPRTTAELLDYVRKLNDEDLDGLLEDQEWRELLLRPLGGDLALHDSYRHRPADRLPTPIAVFGADDDPSTADDALAGWAELTSAECARTSYPGGHFYLRTQRDRLLADLDRHLARALRGHRTTVAEGGIR